MERWGLGLGRVSQKFCKSGKNMFLYYLNCRFIEGIYHHKLCTGPNSNAVGACVQFHGDHTDFYHFELYLLQVFVIWMWDDKLWWNRPGYVSFWNWPNRLIYMVIKPLRPGQDSRDLARLWHWERHWFKCIKFLSFPIWNFLIWEVFHGQERMRNLQH